MKLNKLAPCLAWVSWIGLILLASVSALAVPQNDKRQLTIEWIFGPEGRTVASVPATAWLDDGSLIMLDNRRAPRERTFEKLAPATGQRQPIVDAARALADLKSAAGVNAEVLPWPFSFEGSGRRALYIFKGDVFVLEFASARFQKLTSTAARKFLPSTPRTGFR